VSTPDSPWHRPVPRPNFGDGPSIGGSRPTIPQTPSMQPPTPGPRGVGGTASSGSPPTPVRNGGNAGPPRRPSRKRSGLGREKILQILSIAAGLLFVAGAATAYLNRSDSSQSSSGEPKTTAPSEIPKNVNQVPNSDSNPVGENWEDVARSVVYIEAGGSRCSWSGSGSIVGDGSLVLTNQHVAGNGECDLVVYLTDSTSATPTQSVRAEVVVSDKAMDLAIIQLIDNTGASYAVPGRTPLKLSPVIPKLGDKITILGYPGLGGSTITLTSGDFSGIDQSGAYDYLKTTANMNPGVSGGSAFNGNKQLIGVPTAGRGAEIACNKNTDCVANGSTIGLLRPIGLAQEILDRATIELGK